MEHMDQLLQIFGLLAFVTVVGVIYYRIFYRDELQKSKTMTEKATAVITTPQFDHRTLDDIKKSVYSTSYEFTVDGEVYWGYGKIMNPFRIFKKITIYYNPEDPKKNMTQFERHRSSGALVVHGMLVAIFVIFALPISLIYLL